jgi:hypothetical protein
MREFAIVKGEKVTSVIRADDEERVLPLVRTFDEVAENQMAGPEVWTVHKDKVVAHRTALRALVGSVAILDENGEFMEARFLEKQTHVANNVVPYFEENEPGPEFNKARHVLDGYDYVVADGKVTRKFKIRNFTKAELAEQAAQVEREKLAAAGLAGAHLDRELDRENRLRAFMKQKPITKEEYLAEQKARL